MECSKHIYCVCGQPYDEKRFMIQCDNCREWFHGNCVNVHEYVSIDLDKYHCPQCEVTCGPSVFKKQYNFHRHNYTDMEADNKPVQTGTPVFIEELKTRHFLSADPVVTRLKGHQLTLNYLYQNGFDQPIIIEDKEGLDIRVPSEYFTVQDVEALVGSDREVDVIDVARQSDIKMIFGDFVSYFNNPMRQRVLNLISLEFSNTKLSELVEAPLVARKLDWVNTVWPLSTGAPPTMYKRPEVQKYCLIGVKDSYTDFHIDFGGTSVWYHVVRGEKIFYLIKPTMANLSLYQRWMTSSTQHETFFGDQVDCCYRCIVQAGQTMMIPTGWIHAVLTPVDTLVFGGNFLHSLNIPMQLQIYEIEKKVRTPERFRFPAFETINWYAAKQLCDELKMLNDESSKVPAYLLQGVKALLFTLKQWSQDRDTNKSRKEEIPSIIDAPKLLKDLSKEIRHAEKYLNSLHPPKPERESKRKKKKPVNKDFVDYSQPQNSILLAQVMGSNSPNRKEATKNKEVAFTKPLSLSRHDVDLLNRNKKPHEKLLKSTPSADNQISSSVNLKRPVIFPKPLMYPYKYSGTLTETENSMIELKYPSTQETNVNILQQKLPLHESTVLKTPLNQHKKSNFPWQQSLPRHKLNVPAKELAKTYKIEGPSKSLKGPLPQLLVHLFNTTSPSWFIEEIPKGKNLKMSNLPNLHHTTTQLPNDSEGGSSLPNQIAKNILSGKSCSDDHKYGKHLDICMLPNDHRNAKCYCCLQGDIVQSHSSYKQIVSDQINNKEVHIIKKSISSFKTEADSEERTSNIPLHSQQQEAEFENFVIKTERCELEFSEEESYNNTQSLSQNNSEVEIENPNVNLMDMSDSLSCPGNDNLVIKEDIEIVEEPLLSIKTEPDFIEETSNGSLLSHRNLVGDLDRCMLPNDHIYAKCYCCLQGDILQSHSSFKQIVSDQIINKEVHKIKECISSFKTEPDSEERTSNIPLHSQQQEAEFENFVIKTERCELEFSEEESYNNTQSLSQNNSEVEIENPNVNLMDMSDSLSCPGNDNLVIKEDIEIVEEPLVSIKTEPDFIEETSNGSLLSHRNLVGDLDRCMLPNDHIYAKCYCCLQGDILQSHSSFKQIVSDQIINKEVHIIKECISSFKTEPDSEERTSNIPLHSQQQEAEFENFVIKTKRCEREFCEEESYNNIQSLSQNNSEVEIENPNVNLMDMSDSLSCPGNDNLVIKEDIEIVEEPLLSIKTEPDFIEETSNISLLSHRNSVGDSEENKTDHMKMEPKEPIKLNMKMLSKKLQTKEDSEVRPPLKLTLPKPVMYPYTTPLCENKQKKEDIIEQPGAENKSWFIAMDHRSPHVKMKNEIIGLKVKLAKQEIPFINLPPNPPVHQSFKDDYLDSKNQIESVYDFREDEDFPDDEDDNCLTIDESPRKRRWSKGSAPVEQSSASLKAKWAQANHSQIHLNNLLMNLKGIKSEDLNSVDVTSDLPKNGIDELLKASGYTRDESPRIEDLESGRTSPSTREAIAGMLSISRMYQVEGEGEPSSSHHTGTPRVKKKRHQTPHVDEVEDIDKVHQDDDFIYPSLDLSDEEEERTTRGGKRKVDEAWNPKARVGHVAPKTDRPCREGAKKQSVEKGLEAAAAKRASLPSPKRPYHRKKPKFVPLSVEQPSSSHSTLLPSSSIRPVTTAVDLKNRKPKKGMATAKQRLGKILKLHKMYH